MVTEPEAMKVSQAIGRLKHEMAQALARVEEASHYANGLMGNARGVCVTLSTDPDAPDGTLNHGIAVAQDFAQHAATIATAGALLDATLDQVNEDFASIAPLAESPQPSEE